MNNHSINTLQLISLQAYIMPRFSQSVQAVLKQTMLPRAPACFFSEPDIQHITKETGLDPSTIIHWAEKLRWKIKNGMISDIDSYLNSIDENEKVT